MITDNLPSLVIFIKKKMNKHFEEIYFNVGVILSKMEPGV